MDLLRIASRVVAAVAGGMTIVVDEEHNRAVRVPDAAVRETAASLLEERLAAGETVVIGEDDVALVAGKTVVNGESVDADWRELLASLDDDAIDEAISGVLLAGSEGSMGVAVGFSSADRASFPMDWPECLETEDWLGNGDPMVYKTVGVADGTWVDGYDAAEAEDPAYLEWAAKQR